MKSRLLAVLATAVGFLMVAGPMFAHHSPAIYDKANPITFSGTVTEFRFANPHVQVLLEVKDENGNVVTWIGHSSPPRKMYRAGWKRDTLKPGDQITMTGGADKYGRKVMRILKLVGPGGLEFTDGPGGLTFIDAR